MSVDKEQLDRIRGLLWAHAMGDAAGYPLESLSKHSINDSRITRQNFDFPLPQLLKPQRKINDEADWSETDHLLLVMMSLQENNGKIEPVDIARKLFNWKKKGFEELGDTSGRGCGELNVHCSKKKFVTHPLEVAKRHKRLTNMPVIRIAVLTLLNKNYNDVMRETQLLCSITHQELSVVVSCLVINTILYNIIHKTDFDYLRYRQMLEDPEEMLKFDRYTQFKTLNECELDSYDRLTENFNGDIDYCFKPMGCAIYAYFSYKRGFYKILLDVYFEGGDTDTNGGDSWSSDGCNYRFHKFT